MIYLNKILDLINKVNFTSVQQYLLLRGWQRQKTNKEDIVVFISPDNNPTLDIILPLTRTYSDYDKVIFESIKKIALYEERDEIQIVNDLIAPPADIVRYKVENDSTTNGLIPLKSGFELFESAKKTLLSAASDTISPALFHHRMSYKSAVQFIDSCFFGQTERGSFIASIVCPFMNVSSDEKPIQLSMFSSEETLQTSFTRKVTSKVMESISRIKKGIEIGDVEEFIEPTDSNIISANFLESLVEMNEFTQKSKIVISTTWAPTIPLPNVPSFVEITNDYIEPIKSIIDRISPKVVEKVGEYVGKISKIEANPDVSNRADGEITFIFINDEEKAISAKVTLKGEDLHEATKAFDEGKNILISGVLKVQARQRTIESPKFKVIG